MVTNYSWIRMEGCMVIIMNKTKFIESLMNKANLSLEDATMVNDILENNFFLSKKNKDTIIDEIVKKLNVSLSEASNIYHIAKDIINEEVKNKLSHPFRNQD